jgi:hypothetical protein
MRNGIADIIQNPTNDHAQAAKALRLPLGDAGASASTYFSVVDLIKRWPEGPVRREIMMVSDGIDRFWGSGPSDLMWTPPLKKAQRAGAFHHLLDLCARRGSLWPHLLAYELGTELSFPDFRRDRRSKVRTEVPNAELVAADRVYVPAGI